jgi:hypothetical protein
LAILVEAEVTTDLKCKNRRTDGVMSRDFRFGSLSTEAANSAAHFRFAPKADPGSQ